MPNLTSLMMMPTARGSRPASSTCRHSRRSTFGTLPDPTQAAMASVIRPTAHPSVGRVSTASSTNAPSHRTDIVSPSVRTRTIQYIAPSAAATPHTYASL